MSKIKYALFTIITLSSVFASARANKLHTEVVFNTAAFSGELSDNIVGEKPYILLSDKEDVLGVLECRNGIPAVGKNYAILTLTNRTWSADKVKFKQQMTDKDCKSLVNAIVSGEKTLKINAGGDANYDFMQAEFIQDMKMSLNSYTE